MLVKKELLRKDDLNKLKLSQKQTNVNTDKESFVIKALSNVLDKMEDPLGKKRGPLK